MRRVDFLHTHSPPALGWVLLAMGAAALTFALWMRHQWQQMASDNQLQAQAVQRMQQEATARKASEARPSPDRVRQEQLRQWVNRPWLSTLRAIEFAMAPSVYLLGLSIDPATGQLRIEAEAASFDRLLNYVQQLDARPELRSVQLRNHEPMASTDQGPQALKFTVTAQWTSP